MSRVTMVAAADADWGIGLRGGLPWQLPADLARFRERTMGLTVVVGTRTAASLPSGLPGRKLVTVSRAGLGDFLSVAEAVRAAPQGEEVIVAGGHGVFAESLGLASSAEVTRVDGRYGCDAFMPDLEAEGWRLAESRHLCPGAVLCRYMPAENGEGTER